MGVCREVEKSFHLHPQETLLLDDILTTGTSIKEIKRAIGQDIDDFDLYVFVLGMTYDSWRDGDVNNDDIESRLRST